MCVFICVCAYLCVCVPCVPDYRTQNFWLMLWLRLPAAFWLLFCTGTGRVPLSTDTPSSCLFIYNSISLLALPVTAAAYGKRLLKFRINKLNVFAVYFKFRLKNLSMEGGKGVQSLYNPSALPDAPTKRNKLSIVFENLRIHLSQFG